MLSEILKDFIPLDAEKLRFPGFVKSNRKHIQDGYYNVKRGKGWQSKNKYCPLCNCKEEEIILTRFDLNYLNIDYFFELITIAREYFPAI